ncbi:hypothetical protein GCM10020360_26050 [Nonlabens tegetincola]
MDEFPGLGSFVSHWCGLPDGEAGGLIEVHEFGHPEAGQDPFNRGTRNAEVVADAMGTPLPGEPEADDAMLTSFR